MKELLTLARAAEKYALEVGVRPEIHLDDFIFRFLIDNLSFDCPDSAIKYYFYDGLKSATQLCALIKEMHFDKKLPLHMLEFASGYGCVTRHLNSSLPGWDSTACDIHAKAVEFNQGTLGAKAIISRDDPRDFVAPERYTLVFALSFFSHMPRSTWSHWLVALYKAVAPGGALIFTTQGRKSVKFFGDPDLDASGYWFRHDSEQKDLDVATYGQTIVSEEFVRREINQWLGREADMFHEGFWWGHQDCYVIRKWPLPAN